MTVMPVGCAPALHSRTFPEDPAFPQLEIAADPERMLDVFRRHLKPAASFPLHIQKCVPFCFRFRDISPRRVLQYTLEVVEPSAGPSCLRSPQVRTQWATAFIFAKEGRARRLWCELLKNGVSRQEVPGLRHTFEPVSFVPDLDMLVTLFPCDPKLHALPRLVSGPPPDLLQMLLTQLGTGDWRAERCDIEPVRYRADLGAVIRYTLTAREARSGAVETKRFYLKLYCERQSGRTSQMQKTLSQRTEQNGFSFARPLTYLPDYRALLLEEAPGISLQEVLLNGGDCLTASARIARAVAAFNQSDLAVTQTHSLEERRDGVIRSAQLVGWACPHLRLAAEHVAMRTVSRLEEVPLSPVHRDLKPDHLFLNGDHVVFVDLDNMALADPTMDPAQLMACLISRLGLDTVPFEQVRTAARVFAKEYCAHVPFSWRRRLPVQYAAALIEVAASIFRYQLPNWKEKIGLAVEEARNSLSAGLD